MADKWLIAARTGVSLERWEQEAPPQARAFPAAPATPAMPSVGAWRAENPPLPADAGGAPAAPRPASPSAAQVGKDLALLTARLDQAFNNLADRPAATSLVLLFARMRAEKKQLHHAFSQPALRPALDALGQAYTQFCVALATALEQGHIDFSSLELAQRQTICNGMGAMLIGASRMVIAPGDRLNEALAGITRHLLASRLPSDRFSQAGNPGHVLHYLNWLSRGLGAGIFTSQLPGLREAFDEGLLAMPGWLGERKISCAQMAKCFWQLATLCRSDMLALSSKEGVAKRIAVLKKLADSPLFEQLCLQGDLVKMGSVCAVLMDFLDRGLLPAQSPHIEKIAVRLLTRFDSSIKQKLSNVTLSSLAGFMQLLRRFHEQGCTHFPGFAQAVLYCGRLTANEVLLAEASAPRLKDLAHLLQSLSILHRSARPGTIVDKVLRAGALNLVNTLAPLTAGQAVKLIDIASLFMPLDYYWSMEFHLPAVSALCNQLALNLRCHSDSGALALLTLQKKSTLLRSITSAVIRKLDAFDPAAQTLVIQALRILALSLSKHPPASFAALDRLSALYCVRFLLDKGGAGLEEFAPTLSVLLGADWMSGHDNPVAAISFAINTLRYGEVPARQLKRARDLARTPRYTRRTRQRLAFDATPGPADGVRQEMSGSSQPVLATPVSGPASFTPPAPAATPVSTTASVTPPAPAYAPVPTSASAGLAASVISLASAAAPALYAIPVVQALPASPALRTRQRGDSGTAKAGKRDGAPAVVEITGLVETAASADQPVSRVAPAAPRAARAGKETRPATRQQRLLWQQRLQQGGQLGELKKMLAAHADLLDPVAGGHWPAICTAVMAGDLATTRWLCSLPSAEIQLASWGAEAGHMDRFLAALDVFENPVMLAFTAWLKFLKRTASRHQALFASIDVVKLRSMPTIRERLAEQKLVAPLTLPSGAARNKADATWPIADKPERHLSDAALQARLFLQSTAPSVQSIQGNIAWIASRADWNGFVVQEPLALDDSNERDQWSGGKLQFMATLEELVRRAPALLESADENGRTPLLHALTQGQYGAARALLDAGVKADIFFEELTSLGAAAQFGSIPMVALLLEHGVPVNFATPAGMTALMSLLADPLPMAEFLIDAGAELNVLSQSGASPLQMAVTMRNLPVAALMLEHGADPNLAGSDNYTPFVNAVSRGDPEIVRLLAEYGGRMDARVSARGTELALLDLALYYYEELWEDPKAVKHQDMMTDSAGYVVDYPEVIRFLIANGAPFNAVGNSAERHLHLLRTRGHTELLALLQNAKAT